MLVFAFQGEPPYAGLLLFGTALGLALWLRPWRLIGVSHPPWPWVLVSATLPLLWGLDAWSLRPGAQEPLPLLSGVPLLVLMAGWPMAIIALVPITFLLLAGTPLEAPEVLHRLLWLGLLPATLALALGAGVRRCLPQQLFGYVLGRAFIGSWLALLLPAWLLLARQPSPDWQPLAVAQLLFTFGEASFTGFLTVLLVALRPAWLATWADRLYLRAGDRPTR